MDLVDIAKGLPAEIRHGLKAKNLDPKYLRNEKTYARISANLQGRNAAEGRAFGDEDYFKARVSEGRSRRLESR